MHKAGHGLLHTRLSATSAEASLAEHHITESALYHKAFMYIVKHVAEIIKY